MEDFIIVITHGEITPVPTSSSLLQLASLFPLRGNHQWVWFVWHNFNYYHDQPGSNIIIVICILQKTSRTHMRAHTHVCAHTPPSPFRLSLFDGLVAPNCDGVSALFRRFRWRSMASRCFIQINTCAGDPVSPRFWVFFVYKKLLGRIETWTRDRMCFQSIRTAWDTSWDDRARIATCSLLTATDRFKKNYSIDGIQLPKQPFKCYTMQDMGGECMTQIYEGVGWGSLLLGRQWSK